MVCSDTQSKDNFCGRVPINLPSTCGSASHAAHCAAFPEHSSVAVEAQCRTAHAGDGAANPGTPVRPANPTEAGNPDLARSRGAAERAVRRSRPVEQRQRVGVLYECRNASNGNVTN